MQLLILLILTDIHQKPLTFFKSIFLCLWLGLVLGVRFGVNLDLRGIFFRLQVCKTFSQILTISRIFTKEGQSAELAWPIKAQ